MATCDVATLVELQSISNQTHYSFVCANRLETVWTKVLFNLTFHFSVDTFRVSNTLKPISNVCWISGRLDMFAKSDWSFLAHKAQPNPPSDQRLGLYMLRLSSIILSSPSPLRPVPATPHHHVQTK